MGQGLNDAIADAQSRLYALRNGPQSHGQRVPAPNNLPAFPNATRATPKTPVQGGGGMRKRWKDPKSGEIYEWDSQHGKVEKYNKNGKHVGEFDPETGAQTKPRDPTRKVQK
ncbi:colicin E3/pyocin S6 family cytotoxin [Streptomyces sp. NPDC059828]|uniref:colicin E3/pyocin S6 family cytotoxin n=1 Tax=Streptomyces sp. NPDC059828 TaxID=3346965 RepID=UPI0036528175